MSESTSRRLHRYEGRTTPVMLGLAVLFLAVYSFQVIWLDIPQPLGYILGYANWIIWFLFLVDLIIRLALTSRRWEFIRTHPVDVASVVLPVLRPLRALKVFTAGQSLLSSRSGIVQTGQAIVLTAALLVYVGALAMLDVEQGAPGAIVENFGDAIWWAMVTVTTVGYGDVYPVTTEGRVIAGALMVVGISVLGAVTATAASWFVRTSEMAEDEIEGRDQKILAANQKRLEAKVDVLESKIDQLLAQRDADQPRSPE